MRAGELCVRDIVTARGDETAVDAARRMAQLDAGDVVVIDDTSGVVRPIGIVTDRDLAIRVLAHPERDPARTRLADILERDLVLATEDDPVEDVVVRMQTHAIRRIPVVAANGSLQGVIALDDVIAWTRDQLISATSVFDRQGRGPDARLRRRR